MLVRDILLMQKLELENFLQKPYIERNVNLPEIHKDIIKVITGPRRSGKSFYMIHELNKQGSFGYVNFDDENLIQVKNYDEIIETVLSIYKNPKILFLDEIQNLSKWELFINRLQRQGYSLIISGSNANLLSQELSTHLTGRHLNTYIFPFSFKEYLKFHNEVLTTEKIKSRCYDYLNRGGFPEPLVKDLDTKEYLSTLLDSIIFKDIIRRYKIRAVGRISELFRYIVSNATQLISLRKLAELSGVKSEHTVLKYLGYFKETFLFFEVNAFSFKIKGQIKSPKKLYLIDNGYYFAKGFRVFNTIGILYENLVAIELKKRELKNELDFYYYKTKQGYEVDFVIRQNMEITQLIQVSYSLQNEKTKTREIRALIHASIELNCDNLIIISETERKIENTEWYGMKKAIQFIPLWEWLRT